MKTDSVNSPGPLDLSESEPQTKEHIQAVPRLPCPYVADGQLDLHVDPKIMEHELSQKLLLVSGTCSTSWAALSGLSGRNTKPQRDLKCQRGGDTSTQCPEEKRGKGLWEGLTKRKGSEMSIK